MLISHQRRMTRARTLRFLNDLEAASGSAMTLYLPEGLTAPELGGMLASLPKSEEIPPEITELIGKSKTGAALFWGQPHRCLVLPPFPIVEKQISANYHVGPLRSLLERDSTVALILIRLGDYAVGVFQGERRLSSKVGTGLVHSRHKKGGSSQRRFERHREKQMEMFFKRICGHAREHLEPHTKQLDYVIYGGEQNTLRSFRKQCHFLKAFDERTLPTTLDIRKPRQATLEGVITEVWSSSLIEWVEGEPCRGGFETRPYTVTVIPS